MAEAKETSRLEAFSDGVFAIAVTLLVLEFKVPGGVDLARGLAHEWPSFLSFALSFVTILIMWANHHANLSRVRRTDGRLIYANGLLLLTVTFIPFPTAVLATHLSAGDARVAAAFYAASFLAVNVAWVFFWRSIATRRHEVAPTITDAHVRSINVALVISLVSYSTAVAVAWLSAVASVAIVILLDVFWTWQALRPQRHGDA